MHSTKKVSSVWQIGVICGFHILHRARESAWPQETEKEPEPTIAHLLHLWPEKANNLAIFFYMKLEHVMHGWLSVCESFLQNARAALACLSMLQNLGEATENAALEFYVCKPLMRKRTCINQHLNSLSAGQGSTFMCCWTFSFGLANQQTLHAALRCTCLMNIWRDHKLHLTTLYSQYNHISSQSFQRNSTIAI